MIFIDESVSGEAASTASVSKLPVDMDDGDIGLAPQKFIAVGEYSRVASKDTPCH